MQVINTTARQKEIEPTEQLSCASVTIYRSLLSTFSASAKPLLVSLRRPRTIRLADPGIGTVLTSVRTRPYHTVGRTVLYFLESSHLPSICPNMTSIASTACTTLTVGQLEQVPTEAELEEAVQAIAEANLPA